ncbi:YqiJ family protein [uncultured Tateyamaria sp.]|uniref:YqiJ family protein n=1 Tax=uncultured Tateyamaria sp. TaxID=455651 RepID=UPI0026389B6D|nr:YqiJ family protein [uncultured Tateyamaria sp.]
MYELLTSSGNFPFSIALAVVAGLFVLEIITALLGGSILGVGTDAPDIDVDMDFDFSAEIDAGADLADGFDSVDMPETEVSSGGIFTWIGARDVPILIWLVSFLTMFGLSGLILQSAMQSTLGFQLPALIASAIAFVPALAVTRVIANWVALLMPKTQTTALRARNLGGYHGTITQGTASRGKPAEVKIKDRHGNIHYLRVEPLHDDDSFAQGTDVTLIRKRGDKFFVI